MASDKNTLPDQELAERIDAMMLKYYKPDEPGASIIVTRKGKPIFRKGYGMAHVELGVKIEPHMVFRLGSITKQFTAVSILMLMEQGKLDLQDEITKFLPDYPTHAHKITIEHLLTHTSGIKSYTSVPDFIKNMRTDFDLQALVDTFKPLPMEFAPGTSFNYNNSAFVMLGLIIEKISGLKYAEFLQKNIFEPLGMKNTYFDMANLIIPGRVAGYKQVGDKFENCDYISMTLPHAAGSLASNVDDMAKWDAALYTEKLVKQESLQKAWTPYTLKDGTSTGYGYGWAASNFQGNTMILHGGGISGFVTDGLRFPKEQVYVSILTNAGRGIPNDLGFRVGRIAIGKPYEDPVAIPFDPAEYVHYTGVYHLPKVEMDLPVIVENGSLVVMSPMGKEELVPLSNTEFASKLNVSFYKFTFDENGCAKTFKMEGLYGAGLGMTGEMTDKPLPTDRKSVEVAGTVLGECAGEYELAPGMKMTISYDGGKLTAIVPGQPVFELHPESESNFFIKEVPVTIEFQKDSAGKVTGMNFVQSGHAMQVKKVK